MVYADSLIYIFLFGVNIFSLLKQKLLHYNQGIVSLGTSVDRYHIGTSIHI